MDDLKAEFVLSLKQATRVCVTIVIVTAMLCGTAMWWKNQDAKVQRHKVNKEAVCVKRWEDYMTTRDRVTNKALAAAKTPDQILNVMTDYDPYNYALTDCR